MVSNVKLRRLCISYHAFMRCCQHYYVHIFLFFPVRNFYLLRVCYKYCCFLQLPLHIFIIYLLFFFYVYVPVQFSPVFATMTIQIFICILYIIYMNSYILCIITVSVCTLQCVLSRYNNNKNAEHIDFDNVNPLNSIPKWIW